MGNLAITVKSLSKRYWISHAQGQQRGFHRSLRQDLTSIFSRSSKKEQFWALKDLNFLVEKGQTLGIIGPNGSGKSTLLKILSRITLPTKGEAYLFGKTSSILEIGVGFHPDLTGRENVFLNGAILGFSKKEIEKDFEDIVQFSGIGKFIDTPIKFYSSGMYLRLAFAIATSSGLKPDILLLDEVLSVGDISFTNKCLKRISELTKDSNITTLFVSHNLEAIQDLCNRALLLKNGKIAAIGKPKEVIKKYRDKIDSVSLTF
jgi:lipopolysaccharide transport system ATP-binding protein